jgi:hypothetical protein
MAKVTTVELAARLKLFEDKSTIYNQTFSMNAVTYTEHSIDRLVLATSSGWQEVNMGGVGTGVYLEAQSSRPILISLDTTTRPWNIGRGVLGGVVAVLGSFTHVYVQNNSSTNTAVVNVAVADENA